MKENKIELMRNTFVDADLIAGGYSTDCYISNFGMINKYSKCLIASNIFTAVNIVRSVKCSFDVFELDKQRYVAKRFAEIIQWRNKDIWPHRYDASIFIARFLNFLGFEIKYLKELEEDFKKAPKDENGRPVKSHPYHIVKHNLDKTIGDLIEK